HRAGRGGAARRGVLPAAQSRLRAGRGAGVPDRARRGQSAPAGAAGGRAGAAGLGGWAAILGAAGAGRGGLPPACEEPRAAQAWLSRRILAENADCPFGRAHAFADIETVETFRTSVPIRDYEGLRPWIERDAETATGVPNPNLKEARSILTTA